MTRQDRITKTFNSKMIELQSEAPIVGVTKRGHPDLLRFPRFLPLCACCFANPPTLYSVKNPKNQEKRVSGLKNPHFPSPQKRAFRVKKIPIFSVVPCREMGIFSFRLETPFSGVRGNGGFSTPKPSFPDFGVFDPCTGSGGSQLLFAGIPQFVQICSDVFTCAPISFQNK